MIALPPTLLFGAAHLGLFSSKSGALSYGVLIAAWGCGMGAVSTSGWSRRTILVVGVAYTVAALAVLPFVSLLAVCSTGDCI